MNEFLSEIDDSIPAVAPLEDDATADDLAVDLPVGASGALSEHNTDVLRDVDEGEVFGTLEEPTEQLYDAPVDEALFEEEPGVSVVAEDRGENRMPEGESDTVTGARQKVQAALDDPEPEATTDGAGTDDPNSMVPPTGGGGEENSSANEDNEDDDDATEVAVVEPQGPDVEQPDEDASDVTDSQQEQDIESRRVLHEETKELLQGGTFVTSAEVVRQIDHPDSFRNSPAVSAGRGILLARRIEDEAGPNEHANFSYSTQYLAAVKEYKGEEEIDNALDALQEVATEEWGQLLAWGIRAEYQDEIRSYGEHMSLEQAIGATGLSRSTLMKRELARQVEMPGGKHAMMVPTQALLDREYWAHQAFESLRREPKPVAFYSTSEVADMLDQRYPATIRKLLYMGLLPGVTLEAPVRGEPQREQRNFYTRIPAPDAEALRDYWEGNQRRTLRAVVRGFIEDNPHQFTITRGQFEANVHRQQQQGGLKHKSEVERLLGASDHFLEYYDLPSGNDAMKALRWNRIERPASRRISEVDARTVRAAVSDVLEKQKDPEAVAAEYGVHKRTVYNWLKAASLGRL